LSMARYFKSTLASRRMSERLSFAAAILLLLLFTVYSTGEKSATSGTVVMVCVYVYPFPISSFDVYWMVRQ
jgi:hypothetical protein